MGLDIIARGMAAKAKKLAEDAINELSMVVEGTMNAQETTFTDLNGNVVTPDLETVYQDVNTYVYYRWNGTNYYAVSDPRNTLKYTAQNLTSEEQAQARTNIGAQSSIGVNPTVTGEEDNLAGLQINDVNYKIVTPSDVDSAINTAIYGAIDADY